MRATRLLAVFTPAAMLLVGCSTGELKQVESHREFKMVGTEEIPKEFISGKGQRFVLSGPAKFVPDPVGEAEAVSPVKGSDTRDTRSEDQMTREELAHALRPVMLYKDHEYTLDGPAYDLADAIIAARGKELKTKGSEGRARVAEEVDLTPGLTQPQGVIGTDSRQIARDNTVFPSNTRVLITNPSMTSGCTGQMIGPTTILTAASCLHNGSGWFGTRSWSPGVDSQDTNPFPYQGGSLYPDPAGDVPMFGCYTPIVPSAWSNGDIAVYYDVALMELSSMYPESCGLDPGNDTGWLGLWVASDAALEGGSGYIYGYPADKANWPQLWGSHGPLSGEGVAIQYEIDTSMGQSGSAIYKFDSAGDRYVVGINRGSINGNTVNYGRRMTSDVHTWIEYNSAL
ncbi:trypsin-like serine peptidase [Sorangium sp. So ce406]|uniref:trypsin-like serine peptidase n=1 Tax=Sorangium sp. So ce406 TaxID=3133311 RepID=UPI003F5C3389